MSRRPETRSVSQSSQPSSTPDASGVYFAAQAAAAVQQFELSRGELLIGKRINSGAFALVYVGRYRGEFVAVKVLRSERVAPRDYATYTKEVNLIKSFDHPHVLGFVGVCCEPPHVCIVTEYMAGGSLFDMLHPKNQAPGAAALVRLPLSRVLRFCTGIASGMVYLHSHGVMHRDLKSGNLLLDAAREHIKVGDFGVARRMDTSVDDSMTSETGTYRWMAPEVIRHGKYDSSVDVYSFGIVLWEMLTGQMPYGHLSPVQAASAVVHNNLRPSIIAQMPANLVALMCVCWNHEARVRPSFDVLLAETQRLLDLETQRPGGAAQAAPPAWAEAFAPLPRAADTDAGESTPQVATPDAADRKAHTWSVEDLTHRLTTAGPTEGAVSQRLGREAGTEEVKVPPGPRRMSTGGTQMRRLSAVVKDDDVVQLQVVSGAAIPCPPEGGGSAAPSDYARGMQPAAQRLRRGFLSSMGITCSPTRQQSRRTQCAVRASAAAGDAGEQRRQAVGVLAALTLLVATPQALAIPQTSACATNSCDDFDYSGKDLRKEYYTKGSLKRANFSNSDLQGVTLFGADLAEANFENANLVDANLGQCNLTGANLKNANVTNAILSSARLDGAVVTNADFSNVILRSDILAKVCANATTSGTNPVTGVDTRESLMCP